MFSNISNTLVPISGGNYGGSNAGNSGYFIFIRGDRNPANINNPNNGNVPVTNTSLDATGNLITGRQLYTVKASTSSSARHFTLIGNPYASPVDLNSLSVNNVLPTYYIWNPNLNSVGGFVTIDFTAGLNISTPNTGFETQYLQSSQAFFAVGGTGSDGTLTFDEKDKSSSNNNYVFRPAAPGESFRSNLYLLNADNSVTLADGNLVQYDNSFGAAVDFQDAVKLGNINETFGLIRDGIHLSIERRPIIVNSDTVFLNLSRTTQRNYQLQLTATALNHPGITGFLKDSYTGDSTALNLNGVTTVNFVIDANAASQNSNRFTAVFERSQDGIVPVTFTNIKAAEQNSDISVSWNVQNEINIKSYTVEKSTDGKTFSSVAVVNASGIAQYNWTDANAVMGENYYRVRSTGSNGEIQYSHVVKVDIGAKAPAIAVYPNPVKDGLIGLQFTNMPKGVYMVKMLTTLGQELITKSITHAGGSASETVPFSKALAKGVYQLQIIKPDNTTTSISITY